MANLKRNIGYNFAYQLLILALPLITAPYLARVVGAEGVGVYSYSYAIATYFVYFVKLGLDNYGNRSIARVQGDRRERTRVFWSIYAMQAACFVLVAAVYLGYSFLLAGDLSVALLQGLYVLSSLFDVNWFFFGMEKFGLTVARNTVVKVVTTVLIFVFVNDAGDVDVYIGIMCGGFLLSQLVLWPFLPSHVGLYRPSVREVLPHAKPNTVLFVSVIAVSIYTVLNKIILGGVAGTEAVGFFENAVKISSVPTALVTAVGTVMLPHTSALVAQGKMEEAGRHTEKTLRVMMAFTSVAAFGIALIAVPFTEVFYGPGFGESARALMLLCATIPLLGFGNVVRTQYLIPNARDSVFVQSALCGAVASLAVSLLADPVLGARGAALASVAAEACVLAYQLFRVRREIPLARYLRCAAAYLAAGALMAAALLALVAFGPSFESSVLTTAVRVVVGLAVYAPLCLLVTWLLRRGDAARGANATVEKGE